MSSKMPLGTGARFAALKSKLSSEPGVRNPGAVAASIGRKKYGASVMGKLSHHEPLGKTALMHKAMRGGK